MNIMRGTRFDRITIKVSERFAWMGRVALTGLLVALLVVLASTNHAVAKARQAQIGSVNLGNLTNYLFFFGDGRTDANWQGATKGFAGDVAVNGLVASERTSGGVPYGGTIYTNDSTLDAWQDIVDQNAGQAFASTGQTALINGLKADINNAFLQINGLTATSTTSDPAAAVGSGGLHGLNTTNGIAETFVINVTGGFGISSQISITGDPSDAFILRWDTDANFSNGYNGQVKFQSGGGIVPLGGLSPANFIHVAGDINSSGGGSTPTTNNFPGSPRFNNGYGNLVSGAANFSGGGFFTGYWLTTGSPDNPADATWSVPYGESSSLSNGIFIGGWYSINTKFSMTSGTSGVYVGPLDYGDLPETKYKTTRANSGPSHVITNKLFMGSIFSADLDAEGNGQPNATATGDNLVNQNDERAVTFPSFIRGQNGAVSVLVNNTIGSSATLYGFIDWNNDGDFLDTGEAVSTSVANNTTSAATLTFAVPAGALLDTNLGARFRLSTNTGLGANNGSGTNGPIPASNGEVEDYLVQVNLLDFGDLPEPKYKTTLANSGPRQAVVSTLFMGSVFATDVDAEGNGQPNTTATGDNIVNQNDEQGLTVPVFVPGQSGHMTVAVQNSTGSPATLYGFVDWNSDGDFNDSNEATSVAVANGAASALLPYTVPVGASTGVTLGLRLRLTPATLTLNDAGALGSTTTGPGLGSAAQFTLLGLQNGYLQIHDNSELVGNVGFSAGTSNNECSKVGGSNGPFVGTIYATTGVNINQSSTCQNPGPTGGVIQNAASTALLAQANSDAATAFAYYNSLPANVTIGTAGDVQNFNNSAGASNIFVADITTVNVNGNPWTLTGHAGGDDIFVFRISGSFDWSHGIVVPVNVRPERILWLFNNPAGGQHVLINKADNVFLGTILSPYNSLIEYHNPATFHGAIIAKQINIHSASKISGYPFDATGPASIGEIEDYSKVR